MAWNPRVLPEAKRLPKVLTGRYQLEQDTVGKGMQCLELRGRQTLPEAIDRNLLAGLMEQAGIAAGVPVEARKQSPVDLSFQVRFWPDCLHVKRYNTGSAADCSGTPDAGTLHPYTLRWCTLHNAGLHQVCKGGVAIL